MRNRYTVFSVAAWAIAALAVGLVAGCSAHPVFPQHAAIATQQLHVADWGDVEADPSAFTGRTVSLVGEVFAPYDAQSSPPNVQMFVTSDEPVGAAVIAVNSDPGVKKGDHIAVKGRILGEYTGTGPFAGSGMTAVLVQAFSIEPTTFPEPVKP
ncbi:MAG: hypothetical protein P4L93_10875 [Coriobacteriia bacterium]|nr:hypothetical protein [Coriobacteriia bacterium]